MPANGMEKCAVILMSLGEEHAAEIFKHLNSKEVQRLSIAMSQLRHISTQELSDILIEFEDNTMLYTSLSQDNDGYLRNVLIKALGEERADNLLEEIFDSQETTTGIDTLNFVEPQLASELIRDEHPQIIATILVHLRREQAADILALFDDNLRNDIMLRIATFGGVQPLALAELTEVLNNLLEGQNVKRSKMGGVRTAAEIINLMKSHQEENVIDAVKTYDDELAQKIIDEMFLFENLLGIDSRSIQRLLEEIENESLVIALKGCKPELRDHFLNNMSQRAAEILRDDLESRGPLRLSQVESEQKAILMTVRRLADSGDIMISNGDDSYV
ncbi:flagellar motor switch protein FliG [Moellerella wisconsensis]|uniref:Flagellar motor switch protein FliG n=1 Tax=Moellerella wisconsensis TaxID=158849 RepID=A0ACD3YAR8_9GAMM|nr:flagellar motor switch protein FliG [Moellerella wisconsensis]KLN96298.1 flagellar motor switch protein G [Moellerella wisconsensis]UNH39903.1 flagellar motor switch protein FliG [Moellerella wisconsensis]UNH43563.1 flagellar motor switch protein FliG [Moellerella wisconsensis]WJW82844.1 flagellar motor switch protein FliG [Moellerella wisconsensis]